MIKFVSFLILLFPILVFGQSLQVTEETNEVSLKEYCYHIEDTKDNLSIDEVVEGNWNYLEEGPKFGYVRHYQWLKYNIENTSEKYLDFFVFIPYSHLNKIDFYLIKNGEVVSHKTQGTSQSYGQKDYKSRGYPFKFGLNANDSVSVIMRLDHRQLPLRASAFILSKEKLKKSIDETESLIWFWKGIYLFAIAISLILYLSVRLKLFLYYFAFNLSFLLFMGTELGDYFHFFDVDSNNVISDIKHVGNYFAVYFLALFVGALTPIQQLHPHMWKWMYRLGIPLLLMIPIGFISSLKNTTFYFVTDVYMLSWAMLMLILILFYLVRATIKKKKNAGILLTVYGVYIGLLILNVILPAIGLKTESPSVHNELLMGSIFEILTFMFLMGREAIGVYKDRSILVEKQKFHQREMLIAIVESQETERNRLGRDLHDMVGANMSVIKQKIPENDTGLKKIIGETIESVRNMSHGLVAPRVNGDEFIDEITELCVLASNDSMKIYPYFHNWQKIEDSEVSTHLFRIVQELVQNAVKHSQAKSVHIQFIQEAEKLSILYEDDGIGVQNKVLSKSIVLKSIQNRVDLLEGIIQIGRSYKDVGTSVTIELPIEATR